MNIGPHQFDQPIALAPMAGVSDRVMRELCRRYGAAYAVCEMLSSKTALWNSRKSRARLDTRGETGLRIMQIAGAEPAQMAEAARLAADSGADVIDINMGCPAKKVCNKAAGSALLNDEALVARILAAVVAAVAIPVTLKTRTGPEPAKRNVVRIGQIAADAGISAITLHGRTRACAFRGEAEHTTAAALKAAVRIPLIVNGDISTVAEARAALATSGADGLMLGRAAQGQPWLFAALAAGLRGQPWQAPSRAEKFAVMREHLAGLHDLYGDYAGVRIARKHIGWYLVKLNGDRRVRARFNRLESAGAQFDFLDDLECGVALELAA